MKKVIILTMAGGLVIGAGTWWLIGRKPKKPAFQAVQAERQNLRVTVLATGIVGPQNRVEIKPPISGRVEEILVREGDSARKGQVLAWMSSTERAALLDAARAKGDQELAHWETLYRPTPLIAPLTGVIIARKVEPGQTVTSEAVLVMANRLIVRAQVDETDIGKVKVGQKAEITLDAYANEVIRGRVDHIAYEAETVSNVTIYKVEVAPLTVPDFMRSGMTANVTFVVEEKEAALTVPTEAVSMVEEESFVLVPGQAQGRPERRPVETGISDGKNTEIVSGLNDGESVLLKSFSLDGNRQGTNPFMPSRRQNNRSSGSGQRRQ